MHKALIQHISKVIDLSEFEVDVINKYVETHQLKKKEFILQESKICNKMYFVEKGCLRIQASFRRYYNRHSRIQTSFRSYYNRLSRTQMSFTHYSNGYLRTQTSFYRYTNGYSRTRMSFTHSSKGYLRTRMSLTYLAKWSFGLRYPGTGPGSRLFL